jgi:cytochrome d ubiquinol oxidase subunit II
VAQALPLVWFVLLELTLILFVVLDGADLGIGVLALRPTDEAERSAMLAAIGPLWYANETWLVIAGAILFGAFPLAYAIVLSSLYVPAMMLIFGLILRAAAIEFRAHARAKSFWGAAFAVGSLLAVLGQGFMIGGVLSGVRVAGRVFAGRPWDWLSPVSALIALGAVAGHAMLGAAYLQRRLRRTTGPFPHPHRRRLRVAAAACAGLSLATIAALPLVHLPLAAAWLRPPRVFAISVLLGGAALGYAMVLRRAAGSREDRRAYPWAVVVFLCTAAGVTAGIFPYFVPFSLPIAEAAAPPATLGLMLLAVGPILPVIVAYNLYVRHVFREKVQGEPHDGEY